MFVEANPERDSKAFDLPELDWWNMSSLQKVRTKKVCNMC